MSDSSADTLAKALAAAVSGTRHEGRIRVLAEATSTIDECSRHAAEGADAGLVIVALAQTAGRGRRGHHWFSPPGQACLSVLLRPELSPEQLPLLTLATGVAGAEAVRALGVGTARLREPNDILVPAALSGSARWRKVAGALVDAAVQGDELVHAIVSIGINVDLGDAAVPERLLGRVTSLRDELGRAPAHADVIAGFLRQLDSAVQCAESDAPEGLEARRDGVLVELDDYEMPPLSAEEARSEVRT